MHRVYTDPKQYCHPLTRRRCQQYYLQQDATSSQWIIMNRYRVAKHNVATVYFENFVFRFDGTLSKPITFLSTIQSKYLSHNLKVVCCWHKGTQLDVLKSKFGAKITKGASLRAPMVVHGALGALAPLTPRTTNEPEGVGGKVILVFWVWLQISHSLQLGQWMIWYNGYPEISWSVQE